LQYDQTASATKGLLKACTDPFRTVRIRAAGALLGRDLSSASKEEQAAYEKAKAEYWNSLVIWPDRWSSHYNQGIYFDRLGEPEKALAAYQKSMELREDALQPKINASMDYARLGQSTNAYKVLQEAFHLEPKNPLVLFNLALLEAEFKNIDATEKYLRAALEAAPDMAQAAYNLGVLLCRKSDNEGFEWLKKATQLAPENWDYLSVRLFFLEQANRVVDMESALKEAIDSGHAPAEAYFTLIGNYLKSGQKSAALQICKKAKMAPHLPPDARRYAAQIEQEISAP
jgi:tetratricopeptide (TPR) repeat protein